MLLTPLRDVANQKQNPISDITIPRSIDNNYLENSKLEHNQINNEPIRSEYQQQQLNCQQIENISRDSKLAFKIPIPLNPIQMKTIPELRQMLIEHAQATYAGIGLMEYDASAKRTVKQGSDIAVIPLSTNALLQLYYMTHENRARYGMIIEQLDLFATWIGYKHNQDPNVPMTTPAHHTIGVVTAYVEQINVHQDKAPACDRDIFFYGYTSWVGKSSSEVVIHVQQKYAEDDVREIMTAKFVMVTLDAKGKAAPNIKLIHETEEELQQFRLSEHVKKKRAEMKKVSSLANHSPTHDELNILHSLHRTITNPNFALEKSRIQENNENIVLMNDSKYEQSFICFPFQRNLHNKIFGGYLMRKAYEAAYSNAVLFARGVKPIFVFSGEITFYKGVDIGSNLWMKSQVCYTKNNYMQIFVTGETLSPVTNQFETCSTYQFTFKVDGLLATLIPITYSEGIRFLAAKRHFDTFVKA